MSWRRTICSLFGHEHKFRASLIMKVERAGLLCFRSTWIERCYRCDHERRVEYPTDISVKEIASLFTYREVNEVVIPGRKFEVWLDGRPMGFITNHGPILNDDGNCWSASADHETIIIHHTNKFRAAAALW